MIEYVIKPEVAGGLGSLSKIDKSTHPPFVTRLHYEFSGWMGDDIVETFPTFIVTDALFGAIESSRLSGVEFDDVIVTKDRQFEQLFPDVASSLPRWYWLRPVGRTHTSDFSQDDAGRLIVSEKALELLQGFNINNAE